MDENVELIPQRQFGPRSDGEEMRGDEESALRSIAFFGHDSNESTIIKRVGAFQMNGSRVIGFMFRRERENAAPPFWDNIHLGVTTDWRYATRALKLIAALGGVVKHRTILRQCQIVYARNVDMLFLAALARALTGTRAVLVYEVLDIQTVFVGQRFVNRVFRYVERALLRQCDLLVVSSPDFVKCYFEPYQNFSGRWRLLENKVSVHRNPATGASRAQVRDVAPPWVIGWFGNIRCVRSLELFCRIADMLGDRVQIYVRGVAPEVHLPSRLLQSATSGRHNFEYGGPYVSPRDLPTIYGKVHFAWCVDYLDAGSNSDWLLPNRLYEGGLMGAVAMARSETATGRKVEREGLGVVFADPLDIAVVSFLNTLTVDGWEQMRLGVEGKDRRQFVDETDTRDLLEDLDALVQQRSVRG